MDFPPPLMLDPAMLADSPLPNLDDPDSEYEYEYHPTDTETVYLTLDLTSLHGPIRAPRRRQDPSSSTTTPTPSHHDEPDAALSSTETNPNSTSDGVQILGLHTPNPIISYQNQIFSGTWADQIGTELLFTPPEHAHDHDHDHDDPTQHLNPITPLHRGKTFDLVSANSVKILGRKANLISSSANVYAAETFTSDPADAPTGLVRKTAQQSNQARFMERLTRIKREKGEMDTVRTSFSARRTQNLEARLRGWARTDEQLVEIQRLNELALQGDANAMAELEGLYSRLAGNGDEHDLDSDLEQEDL
ncbi:hypothetical protein BO70DRAFT_392292 [Aspergillus heteromorphus CBS 117.55]|uniref:Transcription factor TFIIIC triple barrel domain-containing protein n=1 Tax=Aspergillus heteromorphus CBS 117.55 TaxID=1448321 RepID=A0A317X2Z1_9EURO|nr:uncharacterized protein BO70DRAFT_392292 [Aspergillus heteromorphus CBS 117.55]PWY92923.1 hypothetical protein BO70DRAFT_392292 [Aspergillus heteromorphus CBS 117.55]